MTHQSLLCENMTSSTKPEIHNYRNVVRRTERQPQATCTKFGEVQPCGLVGLGLY